MSRIVKIYFSAMATYIATILCLQAQVPANDNIANAQPLVGVSGNVTGPNVNATAEAGEPPPDGVNPAQSTIWFSWTAPYTGWFDFSTGGSATTNGEDLSTAMSIYFSRSGQPVMSQLVSVGHGVGDPALIHLDAQQGQLYFIQVDGATNAGGVNGQGIIDLGWGMGLISGTIGFATPVFVCSDHDNEIDEETNNQLGFSLRNGDNVPSWYNFGGSPNIPQVPITLVRTGGAVGRCQVFFSLTNAWYTNDYQTNVLITNVLSVDESIQSGGTTYFATNETSFLTNEVFIVMTDDHGVLRSVRVFGDVHGLVEIDTFSGSTPTTLLQTGGTVSNFNLGTLDPTNFASIPVNSTAFQNLLSPVFTNATGTGTDVVQYLTNIYHLQSDFFTVVPAAQAGVDYAPVSGTVTFDDFEMSKDIYLDIAPRGSQGNNFGADWPDPNGFKVLQDVNGKLLMTLSNVALDPQENPSIAPPQLGQATAELNILDAQGNQAAQAYGGALLPGGYFVFNIERSKFRINKDVGQNATVYVEVNGSIKQGQTPTVHYVVDTAPGDYNARTLGWDMFNAAPGSDYAISSNAASFSPAWDFSPPYQGVSGTLTFPAPYTAQPITFPLINQNGAVEFDQDIYLHLYTTWADAAANNAPGPQFDANDGGGPLTPDTNSPEGFVGANYDAHLIINYDNTSRFPGNGTNIQPGGAVDRNFNPDRFVYSEPPINVLPGANATVKAVAVQATDGQSIIGGDFTDYDTLPYNGVARVNLDGQPDQSFQIGTGAEGSVEAIQVDPVGRILIAGTFTSFNGANAQHIARLLPSGALDTTFKSGFAANGPIWAMALDSQGRILIGGDFTSYNITNRNHLARLNTDGSLDTTFDPGSGTDDTIKAIAVDTVGNIVIGGAFSYVNGTNWNRVGRLLSSGALDTSFNPGIGANDVVNAVVVQPDNRIFIGGGFTTYNFSAASHLARLTINGSLDPSFNPGTGSDDAIYSMALQPNGDLLLGGAFTMFNGTRRVGMARLLPQGWVDTSFLDSAYNQFAGLINHYYNTNAVNLNDAPAYANERNVCYAMALQNDGNVLIGGSFLRVGGGYMRDDVRFRWNYARLIGNVTPGPQSGTTNLTGLGNYPGNITFVQTNYSADARSGELFVTIVRTNGSLGPAELTMGTNTLPPGSGAATASDFSLALASGNYPVAQPILPRPIAIGEYGWRLSDGEYGRNSGTQPVLTGSAELLLGLNSNPNTFQDLFANLSLLDVNGFNQLTLGGTPIPFEPALGLPTSQLAIINDNFHAGVFGFSATNYPVVESGGTVTVTVIRTNGSQGSVTVNYATQNGTTNGGFASPAVSGGSNPDFVATTGQLQFNDSETVKTFTVKILDHSTAQPNKFFNVVLFNLTGENGASFDTNFPPFGIPQVSTVTIVDDHFTPGHLMFTAGNYSVLKGGVAAIPVSRNGGALGNVSVQVVATNGTAATNAIAGRDYIPTTTNLTWSTGDVAPKTIYVQTVDDSIVEGPRSISLYLTNAVVQGNPSNAQNGLVIGTPSTATLTVQDTDCAGTVNFSALNYFLSLNAGSGLITVVRSQGTVGTFSVSYNTTSNTGPNSVPATPGIDYTPVSGVLTFFPGVTAQTFSIPISNAHVTNEVFGTNRLIGLVLSNPSGPGVPPPANTTNCAGDTSHSFPRTSFVTLLDPNLILSPAGSVDTTTLNGTGFNSSVESLSLQPNGGILAGGDFSTYSAFPFNSVGRIRADGAPDVSFLFNMAGANGTVWSVLSVPPSSSGVNNGALVGGDFTQLDGINSTRLGRLNFDGSVDESFNTGSGPDNTVFALALDTIPSTVAGAAPSIGYLVAGSFATYDFQAASGIARVTATGALDPTFNVGAGATGQNATVRAVAVQADGKVILGGDFVSFNNATHNHLVRLNQDGSVDTTYLASATGPNDSVRALLIQPDGKLLLGGLFTNVNGTAFNHIARLNTDGSIDPTFNVGVGTDNSVLTLALDSQSRILAAGEFGRADNVTRNGITRLNPNGTVDPSINFGLGANGFVSAIVLQTNDEIDLGGGFTSFDEVPENGFVRLYGGEQAGSGSLEFDRPAYGVTQNASAAVIAIRRVGGTAGQASVNVFTTSGGTASNGVDYLAASNTVVFPPGETFAYFSVPILSDPTISSSTTVNLGLVNSSNAPIGPQTVSTLFITNINTAVEFSASGYRVDENVSSGEALIPVVRLGNLQNTFTVTASASGGTAVPNVDYTPVTETLVFGPNVATQYLQVPLLNNPNMFSDTTVGLQLSSPNNAILTTPSQATLTIASVYSSPGQVSFSQANYVVDEGAGVAMITVNRANGVTGNVVVTLTTSDGTAVAGVNYTAVTTNITFASGEFTKTIGIPIRQLASAAPNTTVNLTLSNPQFGVTLGSPSTAVLTIQNDIQNFAFGSATYFVGEGAGSVTLTILRNGPSTGTVQVHYTTFSPANAYSTNGLAEPNVDYVPVSGTLVFGPGLTFQTIPVRILQGQVVRGPALFSVLLTNASPSLTTQIGIPGAASVSIISDVTGFAFSTNAYTIGQNGGIFVATVNRINPDSGPVSVNFATSDGSATSGVDYIGASGTLNFADGQGSTNITVQIVNQKTVITNRTFNLALSNPSANSFVVPPSSAVVTITNVLAGISFSSLNYAASKCGGPAAITVTRFGLTNTSVSISFATTLGGSAVPTNHYIPTNGTITFAPGQRTQTFNVTVVNDNILGPNRTVNLNLSNPVGAQLLNPSSAQLTIEECNNESFIVPAGTAFVTGAPTPNSGVLYSNETATILMALRNLAGTNTTNLVATLQATNGVTNVVSSQNYGVLIQNGPAIARPFTFNVIGTNGQNITATLNLADGSRSLGTAVFGFSIGGSTLSFSNTSTIVINDATIASPYPSTINVGNVVGNMSKVTATLNNFNHTFTSDVDVLLQGPGATSLLMSHVGYGENESHVNLTFDQAASANLPLETTFASGTYLPTAYTNSPVTATPTLPAPAPAGPYQADLDNFIGTSPTGNWNLWVLDDKRLDVGGISNGWTLHLTVGQVVPENADLQVTVTAAPSAPTTNNVVAYTIGVTNYGPAGATNVIISDMLAPGVIYAGNTFGGSANTNGPLTFSLPVLAVGSGVLFNVMAVPTEVGYSTNIVTAVANQPSINAQNGVTNIMLVGEPTADLGVSISASANPVLAGNGINFIITVTNSGPSQAVGTIVANTLPAGFVLAGVSTATGTLLTNNSSITWTLGTLNSGATATLTVSVVPTLPGLPLDNVSVTSSVYDPAKLNNFASVKTEVDLPSLNFGVIGNALNLNWSGAASFWLEGAINLPPQGMWVQLTTPGGQTSYTLSPTNIYHFFRLRTQVP